MSPLFKVPYDSYLKRFAARSGLSFYIFEEFVVQGSRVSRASDEELSIWNLMVKDITQPMPASKEEILCCFSKYPGPFAIHTRDFVPLRELAYSIFKPTEDRQDIAMGKVGSFHCGSLPPKDVFVSRLIPIGFFYSGSEMPRDLFTKTCPFPLDVRSKVEACLFPFIL